MAWATPHTWVHGEFVDEDLMNEEIRDHLEELWKYTGANQIVVASTGDALMVLHASDGSVKTCITADDSQAGGVKWYTTIPIGTIVIWSGTFSTIPTGFRRCDGNYGTPDLRDRFVIGAGSTYAVGDTGGSVEKNFSHSHVSVAPIAEYEKVYIPEVYSATINHTHTTADYTTIYVVPPNLSFYLIMRTDA